MSNFRSTIAACILFACSTSLAAAGGLKKYVVLPEGYQPNPNATLGLHVGDTLYISGTTGGDLKTRKYPEVFEDEVKQCMAKIGDFLHADKMDYADVVSVQVYLTDISLFQRMNAVYNTYFKTQPPSRTTVQIAKLGAPDAHIEITVTARK